MKMISNTIFNYHFIICLILLSSSALSQSRIESASKQRLVEPQIASIHPTIGQQGTSFPVTITGLDTRWNSSTEYYLDVTMTGTDVSFSSEVIVDDVTITANMEILGTAPIGVRTVNVDTYHDGVYRSIISLIDGFTVNEPSPCNQNGAIIYNTATDKFNFCENGVWVEK